MSTLVMGNHAGTHLDAPAHFLTDGATVDQIPLERCVGEAVVLDLTGVRPHQEITVVDIERALASTLEPHARLLIRTDWDAQFGDDAYFSDFSPLAPETAEWFCEQQVWLVGADIPTLHQHAFAAMHETMLAAGIVIVESLANLRELRERRVFYVGLPLKLRGADGAPIRAAAFDGVFANNGS